MVYARVRHNLKTQFHLQRPVNEQQYESMKQVAVDIQTQLDALRLLESQARAEERISTLQSTEFWRDCRKSNLSW